MSEKLEKIGALWCGTGKAGEDYFWGVIGGKNVIIFKNKYKKEGSNQPDYNVFPQQPKDKLPPKDDEEVPF